MGSKTIVFLGLLATVLLVTSEVAARDLAETSKKTTETAKRTKGVEEGKYPGGVGYGVPYIRAPVGGPPTGGVPYIQVPVGGPPPGGVPYIQVPVGGPPPGGVPYVGVPGGGGRG